jgi:peptidyl-prolyl cis-trans isomerase SurA
MFRPSAHFAASFSILLAAGSAMAAPAAPAPHVAAAKPAPSAPKLAPNVVAQVNGKSITRDDLLGLFELLHGRPLVVEIIKDTVIENEAKRLGVVVSDAELQKAIKTTEDGIVQRQLQGGTPMTYAQFAAQQGISAPLLRWNVYNETLRHDTFVKSLESQIQPLASQIKVAHILIATVPLGGETPAKEPTAEEQAKKDADAKTKIEGILADIKSGKISFEDAARANSDDKSNAPQGGELPFAPRQTFDPTFETAAWSIAKKGDVVGPVKSKFGWHLIKLISKGAEATKAEKDAYHAEQMQRVGQQAADQQTQGRWIDYLVHNAKVTLNPSPVIVANPKLPLGATPVAVTKTAGAK